MIQEWQNEHKSLVHAIPHGFESSFHVTLSLLSPLINSKLSGCWQNKCEQM